MDPSEKEENGLSLVEELENSRELLRRLEEEGKRVQERISSLERLIAQLRCTLSLVSLERITYYEASLREKKEDGA